MDGEPSGVSPEMLLALAEQEWLDGRCNQATALIEQLSLDYDLAYFMGANGNDAD